MSEESDQSNRWNALSFDVEDYYQVSNFESFIVFDDWDKHQSRIERNTRLILEILAERGIRATFFVLGWIAERFPSLVREITSAGHEPAAHGYRHRLVYSLTRSEFREDLKRSVDAIERACGQKVVGHRAASFSVTKRSLWAVDVMRELGLKYDSSIFPVRHPRYGIPDAPCAPYEIQPGFWEFPLATVKIGPVRLPVGGGAYFRLYPYWLTRWGLRRLNRSGVPAVFYLHPWEFDPGQPRFDAPLHVCLRHYHNLHKTAARLHSLCTDFRFTTVREVLGV